MAITNKLRALLHRKKWEPLTTCPTANAAGGTIVAADLGTQMSRIFFICSAALIYTYYGAEDAFVQIKTSGLGGTFGVGTCAEFHPDGPSGTATAGTTTSFTTNLTIVRDMRGHQVLITAGPNAGQVVTIKSNTIGANSVITIVETMGTAFTVASTYVLKTGRLFLFIGSATAPVMGYYDWALDTWTTRAVTGLPTNFLIEGQLITADSKRTGVLVADSTATSASATTIVDTTKAWVVNALANFQVRITSGTGAGQRRSITSNTATALTVPAWTVNPDATSHFVVEGNDDYMYLLGNGAVAAYRYSISGNTWTTLAPGAARSGAPGAGMTADIPMGVADADWNQVTQPWNGRYIYSFRGGAGALMDRYDIALNAWAAVTYGNQQETFTTGTNSVINRERIYINKDSTNRILYFDVVLNAMRPFATLQYGMSTASVGDKMAILDYKDGDEVDFLYLWRSTGVEFFRIMEIK